MRFMGRESTLTAMGSHVDTALELLCANYVFPGKAAAAAQKVRELQAQGAYEGLTEEELGERLTAEFFEVCADKHLRVRLKPAELRGEGMTKEATLAAWREYLRSTNYGIARVERLDGNVGYLDLRGVASSAEGGRAIAAAMELVSQTDALIIDLRKNRGGSPDGVIFWCSYFFPDDETHLNSIYTASTGQTRQYWSLAWLPGQRYLDRPVYVLTSDMTFSGGEELCYNLQAQGRAVLIGETTRGGAHPTDGFPITDTLEITVPTARSINPVTGTNWEGVGVKPDVEVPAEEAFALAYRKALDHVVDTTESASIRQEAQTTRSGLV
jgi:C-terminal processing protease CtpA/Prc